MPSAGECESRAGTPAVCEYLAGIATTLGPVLTAPMLCQIGLSHPVFRPPKADPAWLKTLPSSPRGMRRKEGKEVGESRNACRTFQFGSTSLAHPEALACSAGHRCCSGARASLLRWSPACFPVACERSSACAESEAGSWTAFAAFASVSTKFWVNSGSGQNLFAKNNPQAKEPLQAELEQDVPCQRTLWVPPPPQPAAVNGDARRRCKAHNCRQGRQA